jgi:hypothetical protein
MGNTITPAARPPSPSSPAARAATVAAPAAAATATGHSPVSSFEPGAPAAAPAAKAPAPKVPDEDTGPHGNDDTKKSKYYDPALNKPGFSSRENRVAQQPNIPKPLKEALLAGKTFKEVMADPALEKLFNALPKGSDAAARATGLALSNQVRHDIRHAWLAEINASALKIHY